MSKTLIDLKQNFIEDLNSLNNLDNKISQTHLRQLAVKKAAIFVNNNPEFVENKIIRSGMIDYVCNNIKNDDKISNEYAQTYVCHTYLRLIHIQQELEQSEM